MVTPYVKPAATKPVRPAKRGQYNASNLYSKTKPKRYTPGRIGWLTW